LKPAFSAELHGIAACAALAFHVGSDWRFNIEMIDSWRFARGKLGG